MAVNVKYFGPMIDATDGKESESHNAQSTDELKKILSEKYPGSTGINYTISVNQEIFDENVNITERDEVAILPPFAGG